MASRTVLRLTEFPVEVLSMIFSMTDSEDRVNLSQVCQIFDLVLQRPELNRSHDFQRSYDLDANNIYTFLKDKSRCSFITAINLTSCYWISSATIKKCLMRLKNLNTMHVADTKITRSDLSALIAALPKVTNISFSWNGPINVGPRAGDLQSIYVYVPALNLDSSLQILAFLKLCKRVEKISIICSMIPRDKEGPRVQRISVNLSLPSARSLLLVAGKWHAHSFSSDVDVGSWTIVHTLMSATATDSNVAWESFWLPAPWKPWGLYREGKSVYGGSQVSPLMKRACLDEELDIQDDSVLTSLSKLLSLSIFCDSQGVDVVIPSLFEGNCGLEELYLYGPYSKKVLPLCRSMTNTLSSNRLRELCIPACGIWREKRAQPNSSTPSFHGLAKKPRVSRIKTDETPADSPFQTLVRAFPNIEVFAMDNLEKNFLSCELPDNFEWDSEQLIHISGWKKLRKLTLGGIPVSSFTFLDEIGRSCPNVTSLSLNYLHLTASAVNMSGLVKALPLFSKLEDVAIRQPTGFSVLHGLSQESLRRVLMICKEVSGTAFGEFLTTCDKVIFLYVICDISKAEIQRIKTPLQRRFANRQALIFHIVSMGGRKWPDEHPEPEAKRIPGVHANEMLTRGVWIAGPRPGDNYI